MTVKFAVTTGEAFLPCPGLNNRRATRHVYSHSELVTLPARVGAAAVTGLGHFYRCTETNELRRWGFDATYGKDDGSN